MGGGRNQHGAELLVGEKLDGGVGKYAQEGGRVAPEEAPHASLGVDVAHCGHDPEPGAGVFGELRIRRLEKNLHPVERADDGLGLGSVRVSIIEWVYGSETARRCPVDRGEGENVTERGGEGQW